MTDQQNLDWLKTEWVLIKEQRCRVHNEENVTKTWAPGRRKTPMKTSAGIAGIELWQVTVIDSLSPTSEVRLEPWNNGAITDVCASQCVCDLYCYDNGLIVTYPA